MKWLLSFSLVLMCSSFVSADARDDAVLRLQKGEYYYEYLTQNFPKALNLSNQKQLFEHDSTGEAMVMKAAMLLSIGLTDEAQALFTEYVAIHAPVKNKMLAKDIADEEDFKTIDQAELEGQVADKTNQVPVANNLDGQKNSIPVVELSRETKKVLQENGRAWFYLAKRWYELGFWENTLTALEQAKALGLSARYKEEFLFLKSSTLLELGFVKKASNALAKMTNGDIWTSYARHNFLLSYLGGNASGRSLDLFLVDSLYFVPETEEGKAIYDRMNLVAGIHFLESGRSRKAVKYFRNISLDGPYTAPALLYYGWANIDLWQYEDSLQPWRELQSSFNPYTTEVIESLASVPYVLEMLKVQTQALRTYEFTESKLVDLVERTGNLREQFPQDPWLDNWLAGQQSDIWGWRAPINDLFEQSETSNALEELLTRSEFVVELSDLRDLNNIEQHLSEQIVNLKLWRSMVAKRRAQFLNSNSSKRIAAMEDQLNSYKQGAQYLGQQMASFAPDSLGLRTLSEVAMYEKIENFKPTLSQLMKTKFGKKDSAMYTERQRRVAGVSLWQQQEEFPERKWQAEKAMRILQKVIFEAEVQLNETKISSGWAVSGWQGFDQKIQQQLASTEKLHAEAAIIRDKQYKRVYGMADDYLADLHSRLKAYLSQTKLAIARLYDDALQEMNAARQERELEEDYESESDADSEETSNGQQNEQADESKEVANG